MAEYVLPIPTLGGKQWWADLVVREGARIQRHVFTGRHRLLGPRDAAWASGSFEDCLQVLERRCKAPPEGPRHIVLCLHGMFRSKDSFAPMRRALQRAGFTAEVVNYPSTRGRLSDHVAQVEHILDHVRGPGRVSFVGHSMGGIVIRMLLGRQGAWTRHLEVGRAVLIGSPNRGAAMVDMLQSSALFRAAGGPAGLALATDEADDWPIPEVPFATIAGIRGNGSGYNPMLRGEDDMTVRRESVLLPGAALHVDVRAIHTLLMRHPDVVAQTTRFLRGS